MSFYFLCALLMYLFGLFVACFTVFVNCLVKRFAMCGCGCCFLMNVMDVFSVGGGALLDRPCMVRFLSLLLLGLCPCVVSVVVFGLSVRFLWYPMWMRWLL